MTARRSLRVLSPARLPGGHQKRVLCLTGLLTHPDPGIRVLAAGALGRLQEPGGLDALLVALHDGDRRVQHRVIRALGALGDPRAIPPLRYLCPRVDRGLQAVIGEAQRAIAEAR